MKLRRGQNFSFSDTNCSMAAALPLLGKLTRAAAGITPQRQMPAFAARTFKQWFHERNAGNPNGQPVLLWPDAFNNHFHPEVARAGVKVLEAAGFRVEVPEQYLCCGRPLYDYGMLTLAKRQLRQILDVLHPQIEAGVYVVGLEPSCVAVFRDEMTNLFPHDEDAKRLSAQTFTLGEFLDRKAEGFELPSLRRKALVVHGHCHHKAIMSINSEEHKEIPVGKQVEVLSLLGDIALFEGEPKLHARAVLGKFDGATVGGHLLEAHALPILEVVIEESPERLGRETDRETGLPLLVVPRIEEVRQEGRPARSRTASVMRVEEW